MNRHGRRTSWVVPACAGVIAAALVAGLLRRSAGRGSRARSLGEPAGNPSGSRQRTENDREADDFGAGGERLTPHELEGYGNFGPSSSRGKAPGDEGGAFGSGGPGG